MDFHWLKHGSAQLLFMFRWLAGVDEGQKTFMLLLMELFYALFVVTTEYRLIKFVRFSIFCQPNSQMQSGI